MILYFFVFRTETIMKNPGIFATMVVYMCFVVGIGFYFYKRAQKIYLSLCLPTCFP